MEMTEVPQIDATNPVQNPDAAAMALTGDTMADLANVAKEMGVNIDSNGNVVEAPAQPAPVAAQPARPQAPPAVPAPAPVQPQAAEQPPQPVEVPPKFQNADGSANVEKIAKAEQNVDAMIERYKAKEREAQQLQNRVNNPAPAQQPVLSQPQPLNPLEIQMAQDLINEAAAQGVQLDQRLALAQARVMARGLDAKYQAEVSATEGLRRQLEDQRRTQELKDMVGQDPSLLTGEMVDKLWNVRQENPWLNQAPEPWKAALHYYRGTQGHAQSVKTPTPTGQTAKAPPTPVSPVARVQSTVPKRPEEMSQDELLSQIKSIYPRFRNY